MNLNVSSEAELELELEGEFKPRDVGEGPARPGSAHLRNCARARSPRNAREVCKSFAQACEPIQLIMCSCLKDLPLLAIRFFLSSGLMTAFDILPELIFHFLE